MTCHLRSAPTRYTFWPMRSSSWEFFGTKCTMSWCSAIYYALEVGIVFFVCITIIEATEGHVVCHMCVLYSQILTSNRKCLSCVLKGIRRVALRFALRCLNLLRLYDKSCNWATHKYYQETAEPVHMSSFPSRCSDRWQNSKEILGQDPRPTWRKIQRDLVTNRDGHDMKWKTDTRGKRGRARWLVFLSGSLECVWGSWSCVFSLILNSAQLHRTVKR